MKRFLLFAFAFLFMSLLAEARQPNRGYRGFFELSSSLRSENFGYFDKDWNIYTRRESVYYYGISTSHGYQIDPMFFIGAGVGFEHCRKTDSWIAPLFVQGRVDLKFGKFTPFGDVRLGVNVSQGAGVYFSPSIGYRFNWGRKTGINVGAGLTLAGYIVEQYEGTWESPNSYEIYYVGRKHLVYPYFSFRIGLDF